MLHVHSTRAVLLRYDSVSAFSLRPCRLSPETTSPSSLAFFMEQPRRPLWSLKLKQQTHHQHPLLASQASQSDISPRNEELCVHEVSEKIVGVLGGGQLGRMLCQAASKMALVKVMVLDPRENCPASSLSCHHMVGSFDDSATVEEFAKSCNALTVEIEHVDVATLEKLEQQGVDCQPKASAIRIIQDKYLQKVHFSEHAIPVPEFMQVDDLEGAKRVGELFGYPLMIKCRRLAYDGRGNAVAKSESELSRALDALGGFDRGLYVEKWVPSIKELAVVVVKERDNSTSCYPVVETIQRDNICYIVKAPANVEQHIRERAAEVACKAVNSLEGAGVFAVELFLTSDEKILLNEVAPRPHNSGHHTLESCYTSQYEQHLRAVLGLPLGDTSMKTPVAVMCNILGQEEGEFGFCLAYELMERASTILGATVYWYDKPEMRNERKMGHITFVLPSLGNIERNLARLVKGRILDDKSAAAPRVGIIMGSDSDLPVMKSAAEILETYGVPYEVRIISAHRTPSLMFSYASSAYERGIQVIIAGAGGAAHLPGMVAALTPLPVIGVPMLSSSLDGIDSLLSIVQMPSDVPVATVGINNATNAGLLALRMLGIADNNLLLRMSQYQEDQRENVLRKGEKLEKDGWESYINEMNKQWTMGHVTLVGLSLGNIERHLARQVEGKIFDDKSAEIFTLINQETAPRVGIMGFDSDLLIMKSAAQILETYGVPYEVRIVSAHQTSEMMFSYAFFAYKRGIRVIIAGTSGAAHLPGMVAAFTPLPVIGVPVRASSINGMHLLSSIMQMPVPVATVTIDIGANAGLLAVKALGIADSNLLSRISQYQEDQRKNVLRKGEKLQKDGWKSYLNST